MERRRPSLNLRAGDPYLESIEGTALTCRCIEILTEEHEIILRIADLLECISKRTESHLVYDQRDVTEILQILRTFGDDFHQAKEEVALFPVLTASCPASEQASIRHLLVEHEKDRSLMNGMQEALFRSNTAQIAEYSLRLANTLRNHVAKEDNILFETITAQLTQEDDAKIVAEFETFDREFDVDQLQRRLRLLEWKYLRKVT
jgi:hemerythrin-like domain-containing protein